RRVVAIDTSTDPFTRSTYGRTSSPCSLAPRQRAALVLLDLYGYGSEEAAAIMRIRPSTVRALATQGRAVLRTAGGPHG
ncbi:MAG: RNA polymerase sigma factor, partial [Actinomycetota bacterium]